MIRSGEQAEPAPIETETDRGREPQGDPIGERGDEPIPDPLEGRADLAAKRNQEAHLRDLRAEARDAAANALDAAAVHQEERREALVPIRDRRLHEAAKRYQSMLSETADASRERAAADRAQAAEDRRLAAEDREFAAAALEQAQAELENAHLDYLTGCYHRSLGMVMLQNEVDRAHREGGSLVLAYVAVDGLTRANDTDGHLSGDVLLRAVAAAMRLKMRSYEPIVRFGGDEFVCAFANVDLEAARQRFGQIQAALREEVHGASISFGLAELEPDEELADLIRRADAALLASRRAPGQPAARD